MTPAAPVKDRAALGILAGGGREGGQLQARGTVVERATAVTPASASPTLAMPAATAALIVIPDTQSAGKKIDLLALARGPTVRTRAAVPYRDPNNYVELSGGSRRNPRASGAKPVRQSRQPRAHYRTTGREIWEQDGGHVDAWRCRQTARAAPIAGLALYLKELRPPWRCVPRRFPHAAPSNKLGNGWRLKAEGSRSPEGDRQQPHHRQPGRGSVDDAVSASTIQSALATIYDLLLARRAVPSDGIRGASCGRGRRGRPGRLGPWPPRS